MMPYDDITRWRFGDAAARLLGGRTRSDPPDDWPCWREPAPALAIDQMITRLKTENREPRLRSRAELEKKAIRCPYYLMRWIIAAAVDEATETAAYDPAEMMQRWRVHEEAASKAAAAINIIVETLLQPTMTPRPRMPALEPPDVMNAYKMTMMVRQSGALNRVVNNARQWQRIFQYDRSEPYHVWRLIFAANLCSAWQVLTGANPARTDPFIEFVEDAYTSLGDDLPEISWTRPIRRALDMGLNWGDWRHYENSFEKLKVKFSSIG
jgi:hypothetical protein